MPSSKKITIIGAGLSGLTTAYRLFQQGYDVSIYEARPRVGGRVLSVYLDNKATELGGQNIFDGGDADNFFQLTREFALETESSTISHSGRFLDHEGWIDLPKTLASYHFNPKELWSTLNTLAAKADNLAQVLDGVLKDDPRLKAILSFRLSAFEGAPPELLSTQTIDSLYHMLLGGVASIHPEAESFRFSWIKGGNAKLAEAIANALKGKVHLNKPLKAIEKTESGEYRLIFSDGTASLCDHLVLTIPCPVYTDLQIAPEVIPSDTLEKIRSLSSGTNSKIVVPLDKPPKSKTMFGTPKVSLYFPGSYEHVVMYYGGLQGSLNKKNFQEVFLRDCHLLKHFSESIDTDVMPVVASDNNFESYSSPITYNWPEDPFAKGSYSYQVAGKEALQTHLIEQEGEQLLKLFSPINNTLFFAGEHCTIRTEIMGTLEAAVESGERTARLMQKTIK